MAFNNVPVNGWPQIKDLEKLDAVAKQIADMPTFTSNDRAFLADLPPYPDTDGTRVLTATTANGETALSYEEQEAGGVTDVINDGVSCVNAEGVATINAVIDGDTYRYDITSSNSGLTINISLYKNGDLQSTRHVSYADVGSGYNVDDRFILHYQNADAWQWELVLSVASSDHEAGYYWRWKTNETVPCSSISFVTSNQTVNLSPFLNTLNTRVPAAPSSNGTYTLKAVVNNGNVSYKWTT